MYGHTVVLLNKIYVGHRIVYHIGQHQQKSVELRQIEKHEIRENFYGDARTPRFFPLDGWLLGV